MKEGALCILSSLAFTYRNWACVCYDKDLDKQHERTKEIPFMQMKYSYI
jgi:hypothetical protein